MARPGDEATHLTYDDQRARADTERARADSAEARIWELEEENRRMRGG